eukprot:m.8574 g.8574  ORF g.8574 m.8574 type:complete len:325 (-) comp2305_c0_seq1:424-1398(-)
MEAELPAPPMSAREKRRAQRRGITSTLPPIEADVANPVPPPGMVIEPPGSTVVDLPQFTQDPEPQPEPIYAQPIPRAERQERVSVRNLEPTADIMAAWQVAAEDVVDGPPPDKRMNATQRTATGMWQTSKNAVGPAPIDHGTPSAMRKVLPPLRDAQHATRPIPEIGATSGFQQRLARRARYIFNVSHGLLAGVATCQVLVAQRLEADSEAFVAEYSRIALSVAPLFLVLLTVCIVSAWNKLQQAWADASRRVVMVTFAVIVYFVAFLFTVGLAGVDVRMDSTCRSDYQWSSYNSVSAWRIVNIVRFVCAVLGWLLLAVDGRLD